MKTNRCLRRALPLCLAAAAVTLFTGERDASANVNFGIEAGVARRKSLKLGFSGGAHLELNPIAGLYIGPYFMHSVQSMADPPGTTDMGVQMNALGGRLRYVLKLDALKGVQPYLLAGAGYTWVWYPTFDASPKGAVNPVLSNQLGLLDERSGNFVEIPLGLGVGYQVGRIVVLDLGFTYRHGVSFKGPAYQPSEPAKTAYEKPTTGWALTLGASLDF